MKQLELLVQLLDQAISGVESGKVEDLLEAQFAMYGVAMGAVPIRAHIDEKVVLLCEYCIDCLSHGERDQEWAAAAVMTELRKGLNQAIASGVLAQEVRELVDVRV